MYKINKLIKKSSKNFKIVILGEPKNDIRELSNKLSKFYGLKIFNFDNLMSKDDLKKDIAEIDNKLRIKLYHLGEKMKDDGFILEGLPIDEDDCSFLGDIDLCIFKNLNTEDIVEFNQDRRWCPTCFKIYHLLLDPPLRKDKCNRCDSSISIRDDDDPRTIRNRLAKWQQNYDKILKKYIDNHNKVLRLNKKDASMDEVSSEIMRILERSKNTETIEFVL